MEKEDVLFQKRLLDLAHKAYQNNMFTFSGFLSLAEQDLFHQMEKDLSFVKCEMYGGASQSERQMLRFGDPKELGYEEAFPIVCIYIRPLIEKFADSFTHRDFLGAIMNLSIERSTIGDIFVSGKEAYVYCNEKMAEYITEQLDQVKHTHVRCTIEEQPQEKAVAEPVRKELVVASKRVDGVIAKVYNMSRTQSIAYFRAKKVYVNGRILENNSYFLKTGDKVTVRGFGKFDFLEELYQTKKDRLCIAVARYE